MQYSNKVEDPLPRMHLLHILNGNSLTRIAGEHEHHGTTFVDSIVNTKLYVSPQATCDDYLYAMLNCSS